jgi:hypothetical protein
MARRVRHPAPARPELDKAIAHVRGKVAAIVRNPDLAFVRSELQKVRGLLKGIERRLDELQTR